MMITVSVTTLLFAVLVLVAIGAKVGKWQTGGIWWKRNASDESTWTWQCGTGKSRRTTTILPASPKQFQIHTAIT